MFMCKSEESLGPCTFTFEHNFFTIACIVKACQLLKLLNLCHDKIYSHAITLYLYHLLEVYIRVIKLIMLLLQIFKH